MNGDEDYEDEEPERKRTAWEVMKEELLIGIARELRPTAAGMESHEDGNVLELSFQELQQRTICESFPGGLDFTSDPGSHRRLFYEKRVEIADEFILYYGSVPGYGIKFTSNPLLGLRWKEDYELERTYSLAGTTEALWALAKGQVPDELKEACDKFLERTRARRALVKEHELNNAKDYLRLAQGEEDGQDDDD